MPAGRPPSLNDEKRSKIYSLVAVGVTLRQAANHVGCSPSCVTRELERNTAFRRQVAQARAEARMTPIETLRTAASTNWRAALAFLDRIEKRKRYADPTKSIVTKGEANHFIDDLLWAIDENIKKPRQKENLLETITAFMPPAMRIRWERDAMGRAMQQVQEELKIRKHNRRVEAEYEINIHYNNCFDLHEEIKQYLPAELRQKIEENLELLLPKQLPAELSEQDEPDETDDDVAEDNDEKSADDDIDECVEESEMA